VSVDLVCCITILLSVVFFISKDTFALCSFVRRSLSLRICPLFSAEDTQSGSNYIKLLKRQQLPVKVGNSRGGVGGISAHIWKRDILAHTAV